MLSKFVLTHIQLTHRAASVQEDQRVYGARGDGHGWGAGWVLSLGDNKNGQSNDLYV